MTQSCVIVSDCNNYGVTALGEVIIGQAMYVLLMYYRVIYRSLSIPAWTHYLQMSVW